ncbi:MAG: hypothetical protein ABJD38_07060, partial [Aurantimonas coralicida]
MTEAIYQLIVDSIELDFSPILDPHPDAPIPLDVAACLPELGGLGFERGPFWTVKRLRGAIARGELRPMRVGKNLFVTRNGIREWREECRVRESQRDFGSNL